VSVTGSIVKYGLSMKWSSAMSAILTNVSPPSVDLRMPMLSPFSKSGKLGMRMVSI